MVSPVKPAAASAAARRRFPPRSERPGVQPGRVASGARRARTADLLGAIQALSQLSYSPAATDCSVVSPYDDPVRAVVLDAEGQPRLAEIEAPEPSARVLAAGLCGSDVEKIGRAAAGTVLGHEVVASVGGERVALVHHHPCGQCERCRAGHESTCEQFPEATIVPGGFAEYVAISDGVVLPDEIDDARGTMVEPLACVLRGAERVPRGRVLVVAQGFIGRLFSLVLAQRGDDVFAVDSDPRRAGRAPDGPVAAAVVCGAGAGAAALEALEPGGTLVVFADAGPLPAELVYRRELTVVGSRSATPESMRDAVALLPELDVPEPVVLPLTRFAEGLDLFLRREALKVVFVP
jgi:L-iditol 2-dehydrogenase